MCVYPQQLTPCAPAIVWSAWCLLTRQNDDPQTHDRLYDCTLSDDGTSVRFSGASPKSACAQPGYVPGLSYQEMAAVPGLLEKYAPWDLCAADPAACGDLTWKFACVPYERRAELAPGVTYLNLPS